MYHVSKQQPPPQKRKKKLHDIKIKSMYQMLKKMHYVQPDTVFK